MITEKPEPDGCRQDDDYGSEYPVLTSWGTRIFLAICCAIVLTICYFSYEMSTVPSVEQHEIGEERR